MDSRPSSSRTDLHFDDFHPSTPAEWTEAAAAALQGAGWEERLRTRTPEGITLEPIYPIGAGSEGATQDAWPGHPPYRRGARAAGYRAGGWSIEQRAVAPTAAAFNAALHEELAGGVTAARVPLRQAEGADGWPGVTWRADGVDDLERAVAGIDLSEVPLIVQTPASGRAPLEAILALAERRGVRGTALRGGVEADPLSGLVRRGRFPSDQAGLFDDLARAVEESGERAPALTALGISGLPYADGGADAVQEVALILAAGVEVLAALVERGIGVGAAAPRTVVTVSLGSHLLMEIAKLRALRLLWARMVEAFGGDAAAQRVRVRGRGAGWSLSAAEPAMNALRATVQGFVAVVGQVDALELIPFDAVGGAAPGERARRLARNTQLILRHEAHLTPVIDPLGGSTAVETLTDEVARRGWALFQDVEREGGLVAALERGLPQRWVAEQAEGRRARLTTGRAVLVGVNRYADLAQPVLAETEEGAEGEAGRPGEGGGGGPRVEPIRPERGSEPFEALRRRAARHVAATGAPLRAALVGVGPAAAVRPRMDYSRDVLAVGGIGADEGVVMEGIETLADAFGTGAPSVVVLCLPPSATPAEVDAAVAEARGAAPDAVLLTAGIPPGDPPPAGPAGTGETGGRSDGHLHRGMDLVATLTTILDRLGVPGGAA